MQPKMLLPVNTNLNQSNLFAKAGEKDIIIMFHRFKIEWPNNKSEVRTSSLILIGEKTRSAMSIVVGTPTTIAAQVSLMKILI